MNPARKQKKDEGGAIELWRYAGERELRRGGTAHLWIDPDGAELLYTGRSARGVVGSRYEVEVKREGDGVTMIGSPSFDESVRDELAARWEAQHRAAVTANDLRRAEARARREAPDRFGDLTLREVRAMLAKAPAVRAAALLAQVLRYVGAA